MMAWIGPEKFCVVISPTRRMSPFRSASRIWSRKLSASCLPCHSAAQRSRYFSVTISRMGPTFCAMPPWTTTSESCNALRALSGISSRVKTRCCGMSRPREMPCSGSPGDDATPSINLIPGHTPPLSCQPPPLPPIHSPSSARASTSRRSLSRNSPVSDSAWPVARMSTEMSAARRFVDTARREPFGMSFTLETSSRPRPGPSICESRSPSDCPLPSMPGGTTPLAITAALSKPR